MGKITDENFRVLESVDNYEDAALQGMSNQEFTTELARLIEKKNVSTATIVDITGLSKPYINKLKNPSIKDVNPRRCVVIDIALAIDASLEETNNLLKLARYQELYTRDKAESFIIWGMLQKIPGREIRNQLQEKGLDDMFKEK